MFIGDIHMDKKPGQLLEDKVKEKFPHISNKKFAEMVGITPPTFQNLISRGYKNTSVSTMVKISQLLEINILDLFPEILKEAQLPTKKMTASKALLIRQTARKRSEEGTYPDDEETDYYGEQIKYEEQSEKDEILSDEKKNLNELMNLKHSSFKYVEVLKDFTPLQEDIFLLAIFNEQFSSPFKVGTTLVCTNKFESRNIFEYKGKKLLIKYNHKFSIRKVLVDGDIAVLAKTSLLDNEYDIILQDDMNIQAYALILYSITPEN